MQPTIEIYRNEYDDLVKKARKYEQLEANGVDNWRGYGCMCDENMEESCVFCEDDEKL